MMKIDKNTVASIAYKIHIDTPTGELIEFADERNPRSMIFGVDRIMLGLEKNLMGREENTEFDFSLSPDEAFGDYKNDLILDVTKSAFRVDGKINEALLYINNEISMIDNQGNRVKGKVLELGDETVKMNFNHPLAGKSLFISGKIMNVRVVTQEDLQPESSECCGGSCGCGSHDEDTHSDHHGNNEENCQVCGNPPELQGQGIGDCQCGK